MFKEETISLDRSAICGILTYGQVLGRPPVVLFSAGLVHRVGPNRLHVKLARSLAQSGFSVFRVDFNGQGDSLQHADLAVTNETHFLAQILDTLEKKLKVNRFILAGLCSGADTAYRFSLADPRITGLIMINGSGLTGREGEALYPMAEAQIRQRYYKKAVFNLQKWKKMLKGRSRLFKSGNLMRFLPGFHRPVKEALPSGPTPYQAVVEKGISTLIIISEGSVAYDLFRILYPRGVHPPISYHFLPDTDHIITPIGAQHSLIEKINTWMDLQFPMIDSKQPGSHETAIQ